LLDNIIAHYKEYQKLMFNRVDTFYIYRQFAHQMSKSDKWEINLFAGTTSKMRSLLGYLRQIGLLYYLLGWLFVFRFSLYRKRKLTNNKVAIFLYSIVAKVLTVVALILSGARKI
jgi:hypothetical protein